MRRALAIATTLTMLVGGVADKCDKNDNKAPSGRPNVDRQVDPKNKRTVAIRANSRELPYEVIVDVYDETGAHEGTHEYVASPGLYKQTVDYTSGRRLHIRVEVKPPKPNSGARCAIVDGLSNNTEMGPVNNGYRALCELYTKR